MVAFVPPEPISTESAAKLVTTLAPLKEWVAPEILKSLLVVIAPVTWFTFTAALK